ncbi:nuclear transport factor 2 family protein [Streptomyces ipomoeae]|uniref:nuclear transport factor 2 family protein n=1 Tax=Streptomyces ipomoeae TaxID=103232 RepID=UPI00114619F0|nr:nuclear transport factor 2 family protein [Streptomyces ipomoeae]MDX2937201.1 ester cyclase [Streptomyces ipomoeae]TQE28549.1 polyketide cyclase [Streptomyces ipomoeae]
MEPRRLSRRVTVLGVGVLTTAALTLGTTAFAEADTPRKPSTAVSWPAAKEAKEARNKQIVRAFVDLGINQKKPQEAADRYVGDLIQHNPNVADGKEGWVTWAKGFVKAVPDVNVDFKRFLADGDLVTVHTHITLNATDRGLAAMDIFRVKNGKIVEHWDVSTPVPETSANDNTMF